jgi:hypothetical protein
MKKCLGLEGTRKDGVAAMDLGHATGLLVPRLLRDTQASPGDGDEDQADKQSTDLLQHGGERILVQQFVAELGVRGQYAVGGRRD